MNGETTQDKNWQKLKEQYLNQIENELGGQANIEEIINDVRGHLDRRYSELAPEQRNWENFQKIITEMGPPSDYAELSNGKGEPAKKKVSASFIVVLAIFLIALTGGLIVLPKLLNNAPSTSIVDEMKRAIPADKQSDNAHNTAPAIEAAQNWLKLIDEGQYSESWTQTAEFFRKVVNQQQWISSMEAVRKPLGKVLSRKVINSTYTTVLPGASRWAVCRHSVSNVIREQTKRD